MDGRGVNKAVRLHPVITRLVIGIKVKDIFSGKTGYITEIKEKGKFVVVNWDNYGEKEVQSKAIEVV